MNEQRGRGRGRGGDRPRREKPEFDQQTIDVSRVTRVTKGGKQMSFRVCIVIGDRKGRVGYGVEKAKDVQLAMEKAVNQAKKNMIRVPISNDTIPHQVLAKENAGKVLLMPAPRGSGIIAGSVIRTILDLAGVPNASAKILGTTKNKLTNVKATFAALKALRPYVRKPQPMKPQQVQSAAPSSEGETEKKSAPRKAQPRAKAQPKA